MAPLELSTPHLTSWWHHVAPRLGNTSWLHNWGVVSVALVSQQVDLMKSPLCLGLFRKAQLWPVEGWGQREIPSVELVSD